MGELAKVAKATEEAKAAAVDGAAKAEKAGTDAKEASAKAVTAAK